MQQEVIKNPIFYMWRTGNLNASAAIVCDNLLKKQSNITNTIVRGIAKNQWYMKIFANYNSFKN